MAEPESDDDCDSDSDDDDDEAADVCCAFEIARARKGNIVKV